MAKKFFYSVEEKLLDYAFDFEVKYPKIDYSIEDVAEEAADDYHSCHDGWEAHWPLTFYIWNENQEYLGASTVHMEAQPVFYAYHKEEE